MKLAYFTNQYPKISHSFIKREILALESQGISISRFALKSDYHELVDKEDKEEYRKTTLLLSKSPVFILLSVLFFLIKKFKCFISALTLMFKVGWNSDRGILRHGIYFIEGCILARLLLKQGVTHLHTHFGTNPAVVAMLASRLSGIKYSLTIHGSEEFDKPEYLALKEKVENAEFVAAISSYTRSQLFRHVSVSHWEKIKVIHCGLDPKFLEEEINEFPENNQFVCIGRFCEQKGHPLLIQAVSELANEGHDVKVVLVGGGPLEQHLRDTAKKHKVENHIEFAGWMSSNEIIQVLKDSKASILTSFAEGLPVVLMESLALGRPVVTSRITGIPELIRNEMEGFLTSASDLQELKEAIITMCNLNQNQLLEMGKNGKKRVQERHDAKVEANKLIDCFNECH